MSPISLGYIQRKIYLAPRGRHNKNPPLLRAPVARGGEGEKCNYPKMIGLTPYPPLCRPFRASCQQTIVLSSTILFCPPAWQDSRASATGRTVCLAPRSIQTRSTVPTQSPRMPQSRYTIACRVRHRYTPPQSTPPQSPGRGISR